MIKREEDTELYKRKVYIKARSCK